MQVEKKKQLINVLIEGIKDLCHVAIEENVGNNDPLKLIQSSLDYLNAQMNEEKRKAIGDKDIVDKIIETENSEEKKLINMKPANKLMI